MVRSLCRRQERQDHILEKLIEAKTKEEKHRYWFYFLSFVVFLLFMAFIITLCLFFKTTELIKELLQIVGYMIGGGGVMTLIIKHKEPQEKHPTPKIEIEE